MNDVDVLEHPKEQASLVGKIVDAINILKVDAASMITDVGFGIEEYQYTWMVYPGTEEEVLVIGKRLDLTDSEGGTDIYHRFVYPDEDITLEAR